MLHPPTAEELRFDGEIPVSLRLDEQHEILGMKVHVHLMSHSQLKLKDGVGGSL